MHNCRCSHYGTENVSESFQGAHIWSGDVEIFQIEGHETANIAYGWGWKDEDGEIEYIGILNVPPIESPADAVRAAIVSKNFK